MRKIESDQLYLSKRERKGIVILFVLLLLLILIPALNYKNNANPDEDKIHEFMSTINKNNYRTESNKNESNITERYLNVQSQKPEIKSELFAFDPNVMSAEEARKLGINSRTYTILRNYISKVGKLKTADQFRKIYGIDENTFNRLKPFIQISNQEEKQINKYVPKEDNHRIDINKATSHDLLPLPGIGEKLADRIIKYRNILGGFVSSAQLHEVYGLSDSVIQNISKKIYFDGNISKINLNKMEYDSIKSHPYFGYKLAKIILEYRKRNGAISNEMELSKIEAIDSLRLAKIKPYVSY